MPTYPSIPLQIEYANVSQYLSRNANSSLKVMQWGASKGQERLPFLLGFYADVVQWVESNIPSDPNLAAVSAYMYSLCGAFIPQAQVIVGSSGGTIVPPIPSGGSTLMPISSIEFTVGGAGDLIGNGGTILVIPVANIVANSLQVVIDGALVMPNLSDRLSYTVSYGVANTTLTFNSAAQTDQVFYITGWMMVSV